tara:strand:+ start:112 stop:1155 length:1044 start_codon:yes stop_codon:yes gene_type:complete
MFEKNLNNNLFNSKSGLLITGGTGSFGSKFLEKVLKLWPDIGRLVIYSRDELKQWELKERYPEKDYPNLRFFLGDIRDKERLKTALHKIDTVIHAAALKQVPAAEYNPIEFIKTNVIGAENLVQACLETKVKNVIALSTDKASSPINLYGATKLCSDKLFIAANNIRGRSDLILSVVRYGNVMGSRGSVIPFFMKKKLNDFIPITDPKMTRFNISIDDGVNMVLWALNNSVGGEIFVPKLSSYNIVDLANAIAPSCKKKIIGSRPGEKIHEEMITTADSFNTFDIGECFAILPSDWEKLERFNFYKKNHNLVTNNFSYNSGTNTNFLSIEEIRNLIIENINPKFKPT